MSAEPALPPVLARRARERGRAPALDRVLGWVRRQYLQAEPPSVAVEFGASSVGVVRVRREKGVPALVAAAALDLPPGALLPSLVQPNVADAERVRAALRGALERCGVLGGARAALVLPDPAARVTLVPEADLSGKRGADVEELLRFRLRKALPFDVREARLSWATVGSRGSDPAVVVAMMRPVLEGYEAVSRSVGLEPGQVEVAALALARAAFPAGAGGDRLLVNWDEGYASVVIARGDWPILVRTLSGASATPAEMAREVASTLTYYRERLGGAGVVGAVVRATTMAPAEAAALLAAAAGVVPEVLDPLGALGGGAVPAGASLGAAAAALGVS